MAVINRVNSLAPAVFLVKYLVKILFIKQMKMTGIKRPGTGENPAVIESGKQSVI